jgi:hypothetical protein
MATESPDVASGNGLRLILTFVFLFSAYLVIGRLQEYWRLRQFKGPFTTGISWWWHSKAVIGGRAHEYYGDVTEKYGEYLNSFKCQN